MPSDPVVKRRPWGATGALQLHVLVDSVATARFEEGVTLYDGETLAYRPGRVGVSEEIILRGVLGFKCRVGVVKPRGPK